MVAETSRGMADHRHAALAVAKIIRGDAPARPEVLQRSMKGKVGTAIHGFLIIIRPRANPRRAFEALAFGEKLMLYTDCATSPTPSRAFGLTVRREVWTPIIFRPANVSNLQHARSWGARQYSRRKRP